MRIASTLYDVLRPAALFDELGNVLKELALVLAPGVDARTRTWLLGVLAKTGEAPELLELGLEGKSDEVSIHFSLLCQIVVLIVRRFVRQVALQVLCKQVGTSLLDVRALHARPCEGSIL